MLSHSVIILVRSAVDVAQFRAGLGRNHAQRVMAQETNSHDYNEGIRGRTAAAC